MTTAPATPAIGRWVRREDGAPKVTGHAVFAGDLALPGMLHARLVLSPHAHARILDTDLTAARQVPGVAGIYTAADLPLKPTDGFSRPAAPLARDETLFQGQPVVAVVATSEAVAEDAAQLVRVSYEPLAAVSDPEVSLAHSRPLVREPRMSDEHDGGAAGHASVGGGAERVEQPPNAAAAVRYSRGDVARGFREADAVVERTYRTSWVHQAHLEPQSCVAAPDGAGRLTLYTSTQAAYATRHDVAAALGIPSHRVNVVTMEVGGAFGAKYGLIDPLTAALAWDLGRPVRLVYTRAEEFLSGNPAPAAVMRVRTGARRDGTLTALEATVTVDSGAYPSETVGILCALLGGSYRWPNLGIEGYDVYTHKPGGGPYRAPGAPQACFAIEGQIEELARQLDLDPLEMRLTNAVGEGDPLPDGDTWPRIGSREVLETLRDHPTYRDWQRRRGTLAPGEGVGVAFAGWPAAAASASAVCRLEDDGTLTVVVGSSDISGTKTGMLLLAAEAFGGGTGGTEGINIVTADTSTVPFAGASGGSKITYTVGAAVLRAAAEARAQVLAIAADQLEAAPEDLDIVEGRVRVRGVPGRGIDLKDVARLSLDFGARYEPVFGRGSAAPRASAPGFVAHLAHVHVDEETGLVRVLDYVAVQDVGRAINPAGVEDQIRGGVAQGIGWALLEGLVYDDEGLSRTGSLMDYALPSSLTVPAITPVIVEVPSPEGPLGARGVGEPPIIGGAAAIANAILDATGARPTAIPMTPERVLNALQER